MPSSAVLDMITSTYLLITDEEKPRSNAARRGITPRYPLKVKIEHDADDPAEPAPIAAARSTEKKLRAYWVMKGTSPADRQERLLAKLAEVEKAEHPTVVFLT